MQYPKGQVVKSAVRFWVSAPAKSHCRCNALGIGCGIINCAVATKAHAEYIEAVCVAGIVFEHPVHHVVDAFRAPRSSGVLRSNDDGINLSTHFQGVKRPVATHPLQVVSAQAGPVQKEDNGLVGLHRVVIGRCAYPEVIPVVHLVAVGSKSLTDR